MGDLKEEERAGELVGGNSLHATVERKQQEKERLCAP
jgi:hypothetical protein